MRNERTYTHAADYLLGRSPGVQPEPSTLDALRGMVDRALQRPLKSMNPGPNNDAAILDRIRHTLQPGEKLYEWYSRTGIGRAEILASTADQISLRVAQADARNEQDTARMPMFVEKKIMPKKIVF